MIETINKLNRVSRQMLQESDSSAGRGGLRSILKFIRFLADETGGHLALEGLGRDLAHRGST